MTSVCLGLSAWMTACGLFGPEGPTDLAWDWRQPVVLTVGATPWRGAPAISGGTAFVEIENRFVVAVDAATGQEKWRAKVGAGQSGEGLRPSAANFVIAGGAVIAAEVTAVTARDVASGASRWSYTPASTGESNWQAADASRYYLAERDHRVTALSLSSGAVQWSVDLAPATAFPFRTWATLVLGDTVYAAGRQCDDANCVKTHGVIVALAAASGAELWRYATPEDRMDAVALASAGNVLLVSDVFGEGLWAFHRFTRQRLWRARGEANWIGPYSPAAVSGDTAFFGMQDQAVYAIRVSTGEQLWKTRVSGGVDGVSACGAVLFATHLGLTKIDRGSGRVLGFRGTANEEHPTTAGGVVSGNRLIVAGSRAVYAYSCAK